MELNNLLKPRWEGEDYPPALIQEQLGGVMLCAVLAGPLLSLLLLCRLVLWNKSPFVRGLSVPCWQPSTVDSQAQAADKWK